MDGLLLVTFFFPLLVVFNLTISIITFVLTLLVSFGPEFSLILREIFFMEAPKDIKDLVDTGKPLSIVWSVLVSGVTIWTTLSTYGLGGAARHGKQGWRFVQPWSGGVRFVLVQIMTWVTAAISICMPWTTLPGLGWLLPWISDNKTDPASHRGLLIVGSALGMLSNTFCILGLMSYSPKENLQRIDRKQFDYGKWSWNIFGDSTLYWWLFLTLQGTFVFFSWELAVMLEMSQTLKNSMVQSLILIVISSLLAIPLALTNAVAGKWRHGERNYRLSMPCQGGAKFIFFQALGWTLFSVSFVYTMLKLGAVMSNSGDQFSIKFSASLGFASYLCIVASLFYFDPSKVNPLAEENVSEAEEVKGLSSSKSKKLKSSASTPKKISSSKKGARARSASPRFRKSAIGRSKKEREEDNEEEERKDTKEKKEDEVGGTTEEDSDDVWEEVEDEHGNVYFFNEKKNISQTDVPKHLKKVLGHS